jgi:hypothetical protein
VLSDVELKPLYWVIENTCLKPGIPADTIQTHTSATKLSNDGNDQNNIWENESESCHCH